MESLRREFIEALTRLQKLYEQRGEYEQALVYTRRRVSLDPLDESAHRALMHLYFQIGQRNAALRQYQECSRTLKTELHISPENTTTELYERICLRAWFITMPIICARMKRKLLSKRQ